MNALAARLLAPLDDATARLRARVRQTTRRFDSRAQRERIAMLCAVAALTFWAADHLWITPAFERSRAATQQLDQARQALATLHADEAQAHTVGAAQAHALQAEIAQWRQRLAAENDAMRQHQSTLVSPDQMVEVLQQMLPHDGKLRLVDLHSLDRSELGGEPTAPAVAASAAVGTASTPAVYRHGVELTLEGGWGDLVDYLQALEHMPRRVLWGGLSMRVEQYPKVLLTVRLYTLSLDRGWLEI